MVEDTCWPCNFAEKTCRVCLGKYEDVLQGTLAGPSLFFFHVIFVNVPLKVTIAFSARDVS